ncbi:shikimate dehydrogenase [Catellatospora sp. NPDC049609]|uniref:shikimate dehydrogenase n=1 Tax=Catellatospora sp. NPDC049609 TaxID=3155505 RepID=UPI003416BC9C
MTRSERHHVLLGLVGDGIGRSLAPLLHQREADRQGIRLLYTIIDAQVRSLRAQDLPDLLRWAGLLGYRGLNVTYPFKQEVIRHLDELSAEASAVGAVNTVVFEDGRTRGYNTDWSGFRRGFERDFAAAPRDAVVQLGAGGAGSAVAHAMLALGTGHLTVVDPDTDRARQLAGVLGAQFGADRISTGDVADLGPILAGAQGVINATPIGMAHHPGSPVPEAYLRSDLWVADIVYRPTDTALLRAARAAGARTLHGGGMNTFQAVAAFEHFTGLPADVDAMAADSAELLLRDV